MKERIAEFIREKAYKPLSFAELAQAMGIAEKQHTQLRKTLEQMEATGEVVRTRTERYGAPERMNLAVGRLQGHPKGFGFLVQDEPGSEDIFIGRESLNGAWHGDRIVARLTPSTRPGGRVEGEVIRILQRAHSRVVGLFEAAKNGGYVTPDEKRLPDDIFIPKGMTNGAKTGEKVVVQITQWPEARRNAEGRVVERIGMKGQVGVDIVSVIRKFGLPEAFPAAVLKEAEQIPETVTAEAIAEEGRRDLRNWTIVTIDGEDAKDLDDAISLEKVGPNRWKLGVHIADVSYYVTEGSALDREAYKRGTSVYLADRVVPMLPPRLSNGICSLNPAVDRLTLSCVMEIDGEGSVTAYEIFPSVIKTAARMTYTRINQILAKEAGAEQGYEKLVPFFGEMLSLMEVLRIKRGRRGALDFDLPEAKVKLNEQGWPVEIKRVDRGVAERIIEEFMLIANETVAEHVSKKAVPFMYRVHEAPAPDRLAGLKEFLGLFGYNLKLPRDGEIAPKELQAITDWSRGRTEENLVNSVLLRTMRQAVYSDQNLGHFGLAAEFYCHFTSPIRRYPDLVVHRVLRALASHKHGLPGKVKSKLERFMPEAARNSSDRERLAVEAERETVEIKKAEYMSDKVGETFTGIISGVTQWGFFVQLANTVEGLVHVSTLTDDYYHFHEEYYALIGERTRRRFRLGDAVTVKVNRVDVETRQIDFLLDEESSVQTVVAVPEETRSRAARKAALSGRPQQKGREPRATKEAPAAAPAPAPQPTTPAAPAASATVPATEANARKKKRKKAKKGKAATEAGAPVHLPVRQTIEPVQTPGEEHRVVRLHAQGPAKGKLDMWGVPVPSAKARPRGEIADPSVVNPFSINPPPRRERERDRGKVATSADAGPAPATAAAPPEEKPKKGRGRPRRRTGTRKKAPVEE
ncbi:MAG: ribonuclease R [Bacillota bacterium]